MEATFGTKEKLKSKKEIELLFSNGKSIAKYPIRLIYKKNHTDHIVSNNTGVSVSKRNFKKAVDRNRIKRLMREGYRKNKYLVPHSTSHYFTLMFLFTGNKMPDAGLIESKIKTILKQLVIKEQ
ncbi:hypothetical protein GCM10022393_06020 [Aquimarina addita]|uniref:Ribonuclease P protein component n=1 Tax=Aquimarina addita TaxID=870485 RepID=A0ABP7XAH8_9FLAO